MLSRFLDRPQAWLLPALTTPKIHLIGAMLFFVNVSGSHIFNKVDYLKLAFLSFSMVFVGVFYFLRGGELTVSRQFYKPFLFALIPTLATLPGLALSQHIYINGTLYEIYSRIALALWFCFCLLIFRYVKSYTPICFWLASILTFVCGVGVVESYGFSPYLLIGLNGVDQALLNVPSVFTGPVARIESTFGNSNYFSAFVVVAMPVIFSGLLVSIRHQATKLQLSSTMFVGATLLLAMYTLPLAGTRGAIAALIISGILYFFIVFTLSPRYRALLSFAFVVIAAVLALSVVDNDPLLNRFNDLSEGVAWKARFLVWETSINSIKEAPWFGYGPGASYPLFFEYVANDWRLHIGERSFNHAHNQWLEVLQEGGILGLIAYFLFWLSIFYWAVRIIRLSESREYQLYATGIFCGLVSYHLHSLVSVAERMVVINMLAYAMAAWVVAMAWREQIIFPRKIKTLQLNLTHGLPIVFSLFHQSLLTVCILTSCVWFVFFLSGQNLLVRVKAGVTPSSELITYAFDSSDAYVLNEAVQQAYDLNDFQAMNRLARRLDHTFPHYRENDYWLAFSYWQFGLVDKAKVSIDKALVRDSFFPSSLHLRAAIALNENDSRELLESLENIIKYRSCRQGLANCKKIVVKGQVTPTHPDIINIQQQDDYLTLAISSVFLDDLRVYSLETANDAELKPLIVAAAGRIGRQSFFAPQSIHSKKLPMSSLPLEQLRQFIDSTKHLKQLKETRYTADITQERPLADQQNDYHQWVSGKRSRMQELQQQFDDSEARLVEYMDLEKFMRRRAFLHRFMSDLMSIANLKPQAPSLEEKETYFNTL